MLLLPAAHRSAIRCQEGHPMPPTFSNGHVRSLCPDCGAVSTFEYVVAGSEFGAIQLNVPGGAIVHKLMRCAGCWRPGVATVRHPGGNNYVVGKLESFWPTATVV